MQVQQRRHDLQVVLNAMMDFPDQYILLLGGTPQPRLVTGEPRRCPSKGAFKVTNFERDRFW
ncbi:hypothetical protein NCH01_14920 [Neoasaia chiangmaiensis]|nr:hypothetical protein NCH01_14920 [Neoasaia chiangmaiensis]